MNKDIMLIGCLKAQPQADGAYTLKLYTVTNQPLRSFQSPLWFPSKQALLGFVHGLGLLQINKSDVYFVADVELGTGAVTLYNVQQARNCLDRKWIEDRLRQPHFTTWFTT